jgi:hypothetical protein
MKKLITPCLAIVVLGTLEVVALCHNIDGALFSSVIAVIGGIAGYTVKSKVVKNGNGSSKHTQDTSSLL